MTSARQLIAAAPTVIVDFDGPITPLMPPPLNFETASAARRALHARTPLPKPLQATADHLEVLRFAASQGASRMSTVEAMCTSMEVEAASICSPTPHALELLTWLADARKSVAIATNNAPDAVHVFLERFGLKPTVAAIIGRVPKRPDLMKPAPHLLHQALSAVHGQPDHAVFVGDSPSDITAGRAAGVRTIGFANKPGKRSRLANSDALIETISELLPATP